MKTVIAIRDGFHGGVMRPRGTSFEVPDSLRGKWFVPVEEYVAEPVPVNVPKPVSLSEMSGHKAQSALDFITGGKKREATAPKGGRAADQDVLK